MFPAEPLYIYIDFVRFCFVNSISFVILIRLYCKMKRPSCCKKCGKQLEVSVDNTSFIVGLLLTLDILASGHKVTDQVSTCLLKALLNNSSATFVAEAFM